MTLKRLTLIGFVGADAEEKTNSKGSPYTIFSVATKTSWKNADAAWESRTEWHRCDVNLIGYLGGDAESRSTRNVANGKVAGFAATLKKGAHAQVEGELRSREYDKKTVRLPNGNLRRPGTAACLVAPRSTRLR